jgi:hypothetical protein
MVTRPHPSDERKAQMSRFTRHPAAGTYAAVALIAAGLTGAIVDNNGKVGLALFVAGAAGLLFLLARQMYRRLGRRLHRPRHVATGAASVVRVRTIAVAVVVMGALLTVTNVFKATDDDAIRRALNYGAWYGALLVASSLVVVALASMRRWVSATR